MEPVHLIGTGESYLPGPGILDSALSSNLCNKIYISITRKFPDKIIL